MCYEDKNPLNCKIRENLALTIFKDQFIHIQIFVAMSNP